MTEDYNKNLINYFTNKLVNTSPTTSEKYEEINEVSRSNWNDYMPSSWDNMRVEGVIKANDGNLVLYGGYVKNSTTTGFIILTDRNMKPFKYIESFDSGTNLRYIQCMIQGDDGFFYAFDDAEMSYQNSNIANTEKRFIMLNNFSVSLNNDYKVSLRKSYILGADYKNFYCHQMFKEPKYSHFVGCGDYASQSGYWADRSKTIELKVNVGEQNEWKHWEVGTSNVENYPALASYVSFDNNSNTKIQVFSMLITGKTANLFVKGYNDAGFTNNTIHTFSYMVSNEYETYQDSIFLDENNVYFTIDTQNLSGSQGGTPVAFERYVGLHHYNIATSQFETIYEDYYGAYTQVIYKSKIQVYQNQGYLYISYCKNIDETNHTADYYYQRYMGNWSPILIGTTKPFLRTQRGFFVDNSYNMVQVYVYPCNLRGQTWYYPVVKEIFNPNQYNGNSYVDTNFASPLYANLYSNGSLVFSRNLFNISKQGNMTTSSVEVPNTYLNGITIGKNNLISKTNFKMVEDTKNWTKNIYEVVDINFLNTINVIDEDTNKIYPLGAIKVNSSITDGGTTNYSNTRCIKYRINYEDGTNAINNITWQDINDLVKQTSFTIYVEKAIKNIDLISNDESTIYLTINGNFEIDNYYTINQKVRIGDKPQQENLVYNAQNVLYNGEQVKVYTQ